MSDVNVQLKNALIAAIKDKELQKLEFKKSLLKTLEEGVDQDIKNIEDNYKHLENLDSETLISAFSQLKIPELTPSTTNTISIVLNNISSQNSQLFCDILGVANSEFFIKTSFKNPGSNNPHFVPPAQPFFQTPQFGQQFPQPPNFGFQPPFNFQNPEAPFPGFQSNRSTGQQNAGWSFNSVHKKFLIEKMENIYKNLVDQDVGDEILSEFNQAITTFKNTKF